MSLLAGQCVGLIDKIRPAAEILRETVNGAERLIRELSTELNPTLITSRWRTEHFQRTQAGCGPSFDPQLLEDFEDMFFHCRLAIT
jgi:hypothetical protein